ncbi:uncharacterized protein E0L32_000672 [Thyridium curvatum]|uniref:Cell wall proline rich protein n=1 Tax=Thyridium curvatum TaxID=1093900 RepID=A0A507BBQ9_9PEZI|nr:uncharacterized protein E0L32_000672 [Thyridium curvatum]TPX14278.1 hypothetical protein E0L32_000672 [Thyridium curvatum]
MATTVARDLPSQAAAACPDFNPPSMAPGLSHADAQDLNDVEIGQSTFAQQHSSPRAQPPPPNPHFVFPARHSTSSAPSSLSRATGRRSRSTLDTEDLAFAMAPKHEKRPSRSEALPNFNFNPGATMDGAPSPEHALLSPPQSPQSPHAIPIRPSGAGHRRGGSEFVGGKLRAGESITLMSTSPTKSESGMMSPNLAPVKPSGRRGHAHRRSAAISSHDLSMILKPNSPSSPALRGSSAPSSPADFGGRASYAFPEIPPLPTRSEPELRQYLSSTQTAAENASLRTETKPASVPPTPSSKPAARARVGFSDTLEFIPRPLSLVSSDTSSTVTARMGHSVSGSISSIISLSNSTIADREPAASHSRNASRTTDSRPSTAGAVLERVPTLNDDEVSSTCPRRRNSIPNLAPLALPDLTNPPTPSPSKTPKRWSFFSLDPFVGASSPTRLRPISPSSSDTEVQLPETTPLSPEHEPVAIQATRDQNASPDKAAGRKASKKKKKKVRTWAGSILTRKSKPRRKNRRAPTPPPPRTMDLNDEFEIIDTPSVLVTPTVLVTDSQGGATVDTSWRPRPSAEPDDDASFPMIDLDAALGPFNTPLPRNAEWEAAQRSGGSSRRQMHSAAGMSRFTGPGMHYSHRRAESAPEMPPFNRAGLPRFSSNSTMADVFEEDEENEVEEEEGGETDLETSSPEMSPQQNTELAPEEKPASIDIRVTDQSDKQMDKASDLVDDSRSSMGLSRRGSNLSGISDDDRTQPSVALKSEYSASSLHEEVIEEEAMDFTFEDRASACDIAESSTSTTPSPRRVLRGRDLAPVEISPLHLPTQSLAPVSPYTMSHSSAFPSPRSPISYDTNRMSTAPSSVTDDNLQSLLMGEPGPEVRLSSDMPSLTSSNSTMTRDSAFVQPRPQPAFRGERPASFTSTAFGRRRSSLASLHRLISTSHGERSKLSMEVSFPSEPEKKAKVVSKTKRLSRMMQFWKAKENSAP